MSKGTGAAGRDESPAGGRLDLLQALNAAAASLQRSSHSEAEVIRAFKEQIARVGLRGAFGFLEGERLVLQAVVFPNRLINSLEKVVNLQAEGFIIGATAVDNYRHVIQTGQTLFIADSSVTVRQLVPPIAHHLLGHVLGAVGSWPGVCAPLVTQGSIFGLMDVSGPGLTEGDTPAITAFANQLSVALENARLFQAVSQAETQYRRLFETALEGILLLDPDTNQIVSANPQAALMTGYSLAELQQIQVEALFRPEREAEIRAELAVLYRNGRHTFEVPLCRKNGEEWYAQVSAVRYEAGTRPMVQGVLRDVSERKQAEEVLRHAQKMESLGVLAGGVAHDFNNLLSAILGQATLALAKSPPPNPARNHIEKLVKGVERAADLTRQLLAYSGRGQFSLEILYLNDLLEQNLHLMEAAIAKNVRLQLALAEPLLAVEADRGQMQQVIMNVVLNAAEAIGNRPGTVTITTGIQQISEADDIYWQITNQPLPAGRYVFLDVQDNGCGMSEETLRRIFDPFFTTKFTGRGLGLAAVLGIVRGHKGGLRVTSQQGRGSLFRLLFPGNDAQVNGMAAAGLGQEAAGSNSQRGLVLVIDDEELIREAATDILEIEGLQVVTASDGRQGIELYRQRRQEIDVILLDLSMPGLSGYDTFRALQTIDPEVRVIVSSGYSESEAMRPFQGKGVAAFVQKPYDMNKLIEAILSQLKP